MQRDDQNMGTTPGVGTTGAGFGTAGVGATTGTTGTTGTTTGIGTTTDTTRDQESRMHRAADTAREKASNLKSTLADKLESGAQRLRQRSTQHGEGATTDYATGTAGTASTGQRGKMDRATESLAGGMEKSANWVRNANVDSMKSDVERQVRANPGRSLLVAVGVGYLLGKLFRGGRRQDL